MEIRSPRVRFSVAVGILCVKQALKQMRLSLPFNDYNWIRWLPSFGHQRSDNE